MWPLLQYSTLTLLHPRNTLRVQSTPKNGVFEMDEGKITSKGIQRKIDTVRE